MPLSDFLATFEADNVALDFGVFVAEQARSRRVSQPAIIAALRPHITPSQPASSHAPAVTAPALADATTDGEKQPSSLPASPSVAPIPPSPLPGDPAGEAGSLTHAPTSSAAFSPTRGRPDTTRAKIVAVHAEHPEWPSKLIAEHLGISEDAVRATASRKKIKLVSWWDYQRAVAKETAAALRQAAQPIQAPEPAPAPETPPAITPEPATGPSKPKRVTLADQIRAHVADHPNATLVEVADAIGAKMQAVGWAAQKAGITLRKRTHEERSIASAKGAQKRGKPLVPATIAPPDDSAIQPDETVMPEPQALRAFRPAAPTTTRFYIRDHDGRYLHNSLTKCPTGPGPLMTTDRAWGWCDNAQRYRGALKLWPEIATMRKVAP